MFALLIEVLTWVPAVSMAASAIAAATPTQKDNKALKVVQTVLDTVALNIGKAKDR